MNKFQRERSKFIRKCQRLFLEEIKDPIWNTPNAIKHFEMGELVARELRIIKTCGIRNFEELYTCQRANFEVRSGKCKSYEKFYKDNLEYLKEMESRI